jgi:hypothetical protein
MNDFIKFFSVMYPWELILLILGIVLFIVALWGFVRQMKNDSLKAAYAIFLIIPIAMIGFPSIQSFSFLNGLADFDTKLTKYEREPTNSDLRSEIVDQLNQIKPRSMTSPIFANRIAEAYIVLDDLDQAQETMTNIEHKHSDSELLEINKSRLEIAKASKTLESNPYDVRSKQIIRSNADILESQVNPRPIDIQLIEKAKKVR